MTVSRSRGKRIGYLAPTQNQELIREITDRCLVALGRFEVHNEVCAGLLDVSLATWNRYKAGRYPAYLGQDLRTRMTFIAEISESLSRRGLDRWLHSGKAFGRQHVAPLDVMVDVGLPAIAHIRNLVLEMTDNELRQADFRFHIASREIRQF